MSEEIDHEVSICTPYYMFRCTYESESHLTNWELFIMQVILQFQEYDKAKFADMTLPDTLTHYFGLQHIEELLRDTCHSLFDKGFLSKEVDLNSDKISAYIIPMDKVNGIYDINENNNTYISVDEKNNFSYKKPTEVPECPIEDCPFNDNKKIKKRIKRVKEELSELTVDYFIHNLKIDFVRTWPSWSNIDQSQLEEKYKEYKGCIKNNE